MPYFSCYCSIIISKICSSFWLILFCEHSKLFAIKQKLISSPFLFMMYPAYVFMPFMLPVFMYISCILSYIIHCNSFIYATNVMMHKKAPPEPGGGVLKKLNY